MVKLRIRKIGKSLGVILPKKVIRHLNASEGKSLFLIEPANGGYRLTPHNPSLQRKITKAEDIIGRYRDALHLLPSEKQLFIH